MLSPRWRKVLRDLGGNKTRTLLVVLSISVGVFAVGMIATSKKILTEDLAAGYAATNPASAILFTDPFDNDLLQAMHEMEQVGEAEARYSVMVRVQTAGSEDWFSLELIAIRDFDDIRINKVRPERGAWPPPPGELVLEHASLDYIEAEVGDVARLETPNGEQRELRIAGVARDLAPIPPLYSFTTYGYVTFDTLEWLGEPRAFNRLYITVAEAERALDEDYIQRVVARVRDIQVEESGRTVYLAQIPEPGEPPLNFVIAPMTMTLGVLGVFALLLSCFLVFNTISALLAQQVRQIGVMKAIGANTRQIMGMYLTVALAFGLLALVIPLPLGALVARAFCTYMAGILNFELTGFYFPPQVLALQVTISLLVPVLAALYPIIAGVRITVREAISNYGLGKGRFGTSVIDRFAGAVGLPSRPLLLSLRNSVRRKGRLVFTLIPLTLAGTGFIAVFCLRASVLCSLEQVMQYSQYDVAVEFGRPYPTERIEREALSVPGVVRAETWWEMDSAAARLRADGSESDIISIVAPPAATDLMEPILVEGRWLVPEDGNAIVLNDHMLEAEADIEMGNEIVLKIQGVETTWQVVGVVRSVLSPAPIVYANYPAFAQAIGEVGQANSVKIVTEQHDEAFQSEVEKALEERFRGIGLHAKSTEATARTISTVQSGFGVFVIFLLVMAMLVAVVGGLGLMGTMSLSVLERMREIGVMRAIGASDGAVLQIVMVEAILVGVFSSLFGAILALPVSKILCDQLGEQFFKNPFSYVFSAGGVLVWLILVVVLSTLASYLPARRAVQISVREALAYE